MKRRKKLICWVLAAALSLALQVKGVPALGGAPPVLRVIPREWKIPVNEMVGHPVAEVRVTHYGASPDDVRYKIEPSQGNQLHGLGFADASEYFSLHQRGPNALKVYLTKSLEEGFKPGDNLSLSITAHSSSESSQGITSRHEAHVVVLEPHLNPFAPPPPAPTKGTLTTTAPKSPSSSTSSSSSSTATPSQNITIVMKGLDDVDGSAGSNSTSGGGSSPSRSESGAAGANSFVLVLVPVLVVFPALGFVVWFFRGRIRDRGSGCCSAAAARCCGAVARKVSGGSLGMDDLKVEDAAGEFAPAAAANVYKEDGPGRKASAAPSSASSAGHAHLYTATPSGSKSEGEMQLRDGSRWEFPRHRLTFVSMIGEGCFGQVWRYEAEDIGDSEGTTVVAVKTLRNSAGDKEKRDLLHELAMMKMLEPHPNVVSLLGCCTEKDPVFIILEFVDGGTLQDFLRRNRSQHNYRNLHGESQTLTARDLTSYAFQIAKGMSYLASKKVIHRDLAARNVLVSEEDQVCKVADFGFARDVMANNIYERKSEGRLPIRWMAPESLYDNCYTTKSDVWSFGVLMWEIVALGSTPYPGKSASEVMKFVRDGGRLEKPPHCDRALYNHMSYCWAADPDDRPGFGELVADFEAMLVEDTDYIDLNMFPEHAYYNQVSLSDEKV